MEVKKKLSLKKKRSEIYSESSSTNLRGDEVIVVGHTGVKFSDSQSNESCWNSFNECIKRIDEPQEICKRLMLNNSSQSLTRSCGYKSLFLAQEKVVNPKSVYKKLPESCYQCALLRSQPTITYDTADVIIGNAARKRNIGENSYKSNERSSLLNDSISIVAEDSFVIRQNDNLPAAKTLKIYENKQIASVGKITAMGGVHNQITDNVKKLETTVYLEHNNERSTHIVKNTLNEDDACEDIGSDSDVDIMILDIPESSFHENTKCLENSSKQKSNDCKNFFSNGNLTSKKSSQKQLELTKRTFREGQGTPYKERYPKHDCNESYKIDKSTKGEIVKEYKRELVSHKMGKDLENYKKDERNHKQKELHEGSSRYNRFEPKQNQKSRHDINSYDNVSTWSPDFSYNAQKREKSRGGYSIMKRLNTRLNSTSKQRSSRIKIKDSDKNSVLGFQNHASSKNNKDSIPCDQKKIITQCPMCMFNFPMGWTKEEKNNHISDCFSNDLFLDDDADDAISQIEIQM